jgi:alkanesulfonate monooxygenase SsuD/methylene tetrahydromethanopterin reductase-like flavin-dependent oxidoreductase (luciferase family)
MEFGILLSHMEFAKLRDLAQTVEGLGYDLAVLGDHIVYERAQGKVDPRQISYDTMVSAAVAIEATRRLRVGHLVLNNLFRYPVLTAQSIMTLDHLSGGRVAAGLGTGYGETEFRMTGINFPEMKVRLEMLDEALTCIRSLWTNEETTFIGKHYQLREAILYPKPIQKPHPRIIIGGGGRPRAANRRQTRRRGQHHLGSGSLRRFPRRRPDWLRRSAIQRTRRIRTR